MSSREYEPVIGLDLRGDGRGSGWLQPLASGGLWCDEDLGHGGLPAPRPSDPPWEAPSSWTPVYDGPGLLEGRLQRIRSYVGAGGVRRIEAEDGEGFVVGPGGAWIRRVAATAGEPPSPWTVERALGPAMALALAANGRYLLHASALRGPAGVLALTAPSGGGKSTLAAAALDHPELGLARIADDQLPVRLGRHPVALPHFPQLKLPREHWYSVGAPPELPLVGLVEVILEREAEKGTAHQGVALERLGPAAGCIALSKATVAARLFDPALLEGHLEAVTAAAGALPVYRLRYPPGLGRLRHPLSALAELVSHPQSPVV